MHPSPLLPNYRAARVPLLAWGATDAFSGIDCPAALAPIEMEYAALRKHCALLDLPMRGVLEVTGADRIDFLNRMITQELKPKDNSFGVGAVRRSFWLSRKGRIDADLRVLHAASRVLLEVDILAAPRAAAGLAGYIITEDCAVLDISQTTHRLALHGPTAWELLCRVMSPSADVALAPPVPNTCMEVTLASAVCTLYREDSAGVPGFELIVAAAQVEALVRTLIEHGHDPSHADFEAHGRALALRQAANPRTGIRMLPIGWHAYNLARVEERTPLFNLDFGPESLPAESGVLHDRVSFTKGCYLGQEVVARMHARNQSKQQLAFIRFQKPDGEGYPPLPPTGAPLSMIDASGTPQVIGTITSSVPSPKSAMAPVGFAQVKTANAAPGTIVQVEAEGVVLRGVLA